MDEHSDQRNGERTIVETIMSEPFLSRGPGGGDLAFLDVRLMFFAHAMARSSPGQKPVENGQRHQPKVCFEAFLLL